MEKIPSGLSDLDWNVYRCVLLPNHGVSQDALTYDGFGKQISDKAIQIYQFQHPT